MSSEFRRLSMSSAAVSHVSVRVGPKECSQPCQPSRCTRNILEYTSEHERVSEKVGIVVQT